jgi:mannose-6-phosphate isomerase-like protein (cupin superfamily)
MPHQERPVSLPVHPFPLNPAEAAGRMPWSEVNKALGIRARIDGATLEIQGLEHDEGGHPNTGQADTVYVIVSGYGTLRYGDMSLECTEGDVLFTPRGCSHHFERMDGEMRIWRISLILAAAPEE